MQNANELFAPTRTASTRRPRPPHDPCGQINGSRRRVRPDGRDGRRRPGAHFGGTTWSRSRPCPARAPRRRVSAARRRRRCARKALLRHRAPPEAVLASMPRSRSTSSGSRHSAHHAAPASSGARRGHLRAAAARDDVPCDEFHKPGVGGYTSWCSIKDFYSVCAALKVHRSFASPAWRGASPTSAPSRPAVQRICDILRWQKLRVGDVVFECELKYITTCAAPTYGACAAGRPSTGARALSTSTPSPRHAPARWRGGVDSLPPTEPSRGHGIVGVRSHPTHWLDFHTDHHI